MNVAPQWLLAAGLALLGAGCPSRYSANDSAGRTELTQPVKLMDTAPAVSNSNPAAPIAPTDDALRGGRGAALASNDANRGASKFGDVIGLNVKFTQGQPLSDLPVLSDLGVRWVRDTLDWATAEPKPGYFPAFPRAFEQRLTFYRRHGIGVVFILAYQNDVAYPATPAEPHRPIDPVAFGRYAAVVAERLRASGVRFVLEIWNEPHNFVIRPSLSGRWNGSPPSPWLDHYLKMVREAVRQVKALDPSIKLLSDDDMWIIHYWYLEGGLPQDLDGFAFHPYTLASPERAAVDASTDWLRPFAVIDADGSFTSAVRRLREHGQRKLGRQPEMWATEWGWKLRQPSPSGPISERLLAAWLPRAYVSAAAAGVRVVCWFSARDSVDGPLGLMTNDGRKRKPYFALKTLSEQLGDAVYAQHVEGEKHPTSGVQAFLFHGIDDSRLIVWNIDGVSQPLALTGPLSDARVVDIFGRYVAPEVHRNGTRLLMLGQSPHYLRFPKHTGIMSLPVAH